MCLLFFRKWNIISLRETVNISDCAFLSYNSRHNIQRRHWNTDVIQKYFIIKLAIAAVWIVSLAQSSKLTSAFIFLLSNNFALHTKNYFTQFLQYCYTNGDVKIQITQFKVNCRLDFHEWMGLSAIVPIWIKSWTYLKCIHAKIK